MDEERYRQLPVKTDAAHHIELKQEFLDCGYRVEMHGVRRTTNTGLLELLSLVPDDPSRPEFVVRWQHAPQAVDIDPKPQGSIPKRHWRDETAGYRGHHTTLFSTTPPIYQLDVHTPDGTVFRGLLSFNIDLSVYVTDSFPFSDHCEAKVTGAQGPGLLRA